MEKKSNNKKKAEFVKWMGPILDALRKLGGSGTPGEVADLIADDLNLPDSRKQETLKSGALKFPTQVAWAGQYMVWEGLVEFSERRIWKLTEKGQKTKLTDQQATEIFLRWVDIILEERRAINVKEYVENGHYTKEDIEASDTNDCNDCKQQLLELLRNLPQNGFEKLFCRVLHEAGFGKVTLTHDPQGDSIEGMGIFQINPFVSFKVLFQCRRSENSISRAQIGDFRNAMIGRADKGIMITTGKFTEDAVKEADRNGAPPVELVDGERLAEMFEKLRMGLIPKTVYKIDRSFFEPFFT